MRLNRFNDSFRVLSNVGYRRMSKAESRDYGLTGLPYGYGGPFVRDFANGETSGKVLLGSWDDEIIIEVLVRVDGEELSGIREYESNADDAFDDFKYVNRKLNDREDMRAIAKSIRMNLA